MTNPSCITRNTLASGSAPPHTPTKPWASAQRLIVTNPSCISRNTLASGSPPPYTPTKPWASTPQLMGSVFGLVHSILCFAYILYDGIQIIFRIDALPIAQYRPDRAITKCFPVLSQSLCCVRLQLITYLIAAVSGRRHDRMDVIRSDQFRPTFPTTLFAVAFNFLLDHRSLRVVEQSNRILQSITSPLREFRLRQLWALAASTPSPFIALKKRSVDGPSDEVSDGFIVREGIPRGNKRRRLKTNLLEHEMKNRGLALSDRHRQAMHASAATR